MTERQLIDKVREFRQIKPRKDWVVFTKERILGSSSQILQGKTWEGEKKPSFSFISFLREMRKGERFVFQHKPAFAVLVAAVVLLGVFGFAQNSVPGDSLFSLKKITEKSQAVFISKKEQPKRNLELANKRLDDLTKIAESNQTQKLAPAIKEYEESVSQAAESLTAADAETVKKIIEEIKKLEEKTEKIKALGIEIGDGEKLEGLYAKIVEREIEDFEGQVLSEEKQETLAGVKEDYEAGNYEEALDKILLLLNQE